MSVDRDWLKILNSDNDLRRFLAFGGSPWKVEVERETRLASGLRAVEIYRFSAIPETGTALILDSLLPDGKIGTAARQPPYLSSSMLLERLLVSIR
jgi:hypothetical protein